MRSRNAPNLLVCYFSLSLLGLGVGMAVPQSRRTFEEKKKSCTFADRSLSHPSKRITCDDDDVDEEVGFVGNRIAFGAL